MKARAVDGLEPGGSLAANAARVVQVRLGELEDLAVPAFEGDEQALHDMRIAAKRLRYILETTAPAFGEYSAKAAKRAKALQEVLGAIHDHDVMLPRIEKLIETAAGGIDTGGLQAIRAHLLADRAVRFGQVRALWEQMAAERFHGRLEAALTEPRTQ